jgi:predicted short-subunit dehydrogenase-like oxidoreductase (DUF2520 family)
MKVHSPVGLVGAGRINPALAKLNRLSSLLGPVMASSLRVASRIANQLRAGHPVAGWADMSECSLILVSIPDAEIPAVLQSAAAAPIDWRNKAMVLFGGGMESSDMSELSAKGAAVGTVEKMEGFAANRFAIEGDAGALREMRRLLRAAGATAVELKAGKKPLYAAGLAFAGTLYTPLVEAAVDCLRKSGLSPQDAVEFAEARFLRTLRSYVKAGKQGWQGPVAKRDIEAMRRLMAALGEDNPLLVSYFSQTARMALDVFGKDKEWLDGMNSPFSVDSTGTNRLRGVDTHK